MKDISVEYAHIYTNDKIGEEHQLSLDILGKVKELEAGKDISLVVLVDDYSFPDASFDYSAFTEWLAANGFKPDLVLKESELIPVCDEVVLLIEDMRMREELAEYIRTRKYPCSLFIAAWYLLRLGYVRFPLLPEELVARKLLNILPESFKSFEEKGLDIIASTKYKEANDQIEYKYFEGRAIR
ncbi:MAG: hypothetical protein WD850_01380 [Candidatus Spechtbacterales bacterium]